ncbi:MAG: glycosyltransferase family 4 protein [Candidatus Kariarchaeaceae archaeon]|jgi:1,2-diacylglycerol 3-alpha-glucosyltransferase
MRVTILSDAYYPIIDGVVRFVDHLAMTLHQANFDVTLVIPRLYWKPHEEYRDRPYNFIFLPTLPIKFKGYYPALPSGELYREILKTDLIIVNSLAFTALYSLLFNRYHRSKVIEFVHADERVVLAETASAPRFILDRLMKIMKRMTLNIDYFAVATNTFHKRTLEYGAKPETIFRVPFGYKRKNVSEEQLEEIRNLFGIDPDKRTILYLGRLSVEKNIDTIVKVMSRLTEEDPNVQAIIAGGGYMYQSIKNHLEKTDSSIILTGFIPDDYLPPLYSIADIFYSPSNHEALCFTVIEAMSYTTIPILNGKFRENELNTGNSIQLDDIYNVETTVHILKDLIADEQRIDTLKEAVTETAAIFTWKRFGEVWVNKIHEILI